MITNKTITIPITITIKIKITIITTKKSFQFECSKKIFTKTKNL
jgi:hypothetical protein